MKQFNQCAITHYLRGFPELFSVLYCAGPLQQLIEDFNGAIEDSAALLPEQMASRVQNVAKISGLAFILKPLLIRVTK